MIYGIHTIYITDGTGVCNTPTLSPCADTYRNNNTSTLSPFSYDVDKYNNTSTSNTIFGTFNYIWYMVSHHTFLILFYLFLHVIIFYLQPSGGTIKYDILWYIVYFLGFRIYVFPWFSQAKWKTKEFQIDFKQLSK